MDRPVLMAIVLAVMVLLLALMVLGWRRRQRSQSGIPAPQPAPEDRGEVLASAGVFYVATTTAGEPLNRIAVAGLGYRARASAEVAERGITLSIPGEEPIFLPTPHIRDVDKATWTIDRAVEQDGLVLVRWTLVAPGGTSTDVDSYLRAIDPADGDRLFLAARELLGRNIQTGGRSQ